MTRADLLALAEDDARRQIARSLRGPCACGRQKVCRAVEVLGEVEITHREDTPLGPVTVARVDTACRLCGHRAALQAIVQAIVSRPPSGA